MPYRPVPSTTPQPDEVTSRKVLWVAVALMLVGVVAAGLWKRKVVPEAPPGEPVRFEQFVGVYCVSRHRRTYYHGHGCSGLSSRSSGDAIELINDAIRSRPDIVEQASSVPGACFELHYRGFVHAGDRVTVHFVTRLNSSTLCVYP